MRAATAGRRTIRRWRWRSSDARVGARRRRSGRTRASPLASPRLHGVRAVRQTRRRHIARPNSQGRAPARSPRHNATETPALKPSREERHRAAALACRAAASRAPQSGGAVPSRRHTRPALARGAVNQRATCITRRRAAARAPPRRARPPARAARAPASTARACARRSAPARYPDRPPRTAGPAHIRAATAPPAHRPRRRARPRASARTIPAVTPPPVTRLPSRTTRSRTGVAPNGASSEWNAQCVVARRPRSSPAAPSTSAPVHTELT